MTLVEKYLRIMITLVNWLASQLPKSTYLFVPELGLQLRPCLTFHVGSGNPESGPQTCTQPPLQPHCEVFHYTEASSQ